MQNQKGIRTAKPYKLFIESIYPPWSSA